MSTLQAIIFDFDGVIADTEPLHYGALQHVLAELGISLSESQYYADYLGSTTAAALRRRCRRMDA